MKHWGCSSCPTAAVIILLKLNHTVRNSCPAERAHQEQTCPQDIPETWALLQWLYFESLLDVSWMRIISVVLRLPLNIQVPPSVNNLPSDCSVKDCEQTCHLSFCNSYNIPVVQINHGSATRSSSLDLSFFKCEEPFKHALK